MSIQTIATAAGSLATALFIASTIPMLAKAVRTRDLASYSGAHLVGANIGNTAQAVYVATLEPGPIWILHGFNTAATALMLGWWLRYRDTDTAVQRRAAVLVGSSGASRWDDALAALVELAERPRPLPIGIS